MTTPPVPSPSRRSIVIGLGTLAGASLGVGASAVARHGSLSDAGAVTPGELLMTEHGVLKRVLLVYRALLGQRVGGVRGDVLHGGATIIHDYIEGFHEALEERYVFPALRDSDVLVDTVDVLLAQHAAGRRITQSLLDLPSAGHLTGTAEKAARTELGAFVRMYEPHEAREDTVVFPAYRMVVGDSGLARAAQQYEAAERQQLGRNGFVDLLDRVAGLEAAMGIHDLSRFTPTIS